LDGGLEKVQEFVEPVLAKSIKNVLRDNRDRDPKSQLQEYTQAKGMGTPNYVTVSVSGPDHQRIYEVEVVVGETVLGQGAGRSKQAATKAAALDAIDRLEIH